MFEAVVLKLADIKGQRTDSLLSGSTIYVVSNVFNAAIPFVLLPVLTRYLAPAEYGLVGMFLLTLTLLGAFTRLSVHGTVNRKYFDRGFGADLSAYITCCATIVLASTSLVLLIVYLFRNPLAEWIGLSTNSLLLAVVASAMANLATMHLGQWQVRKQGVYFGISEVGRSLLNAGFSIFVVIFLPLGQAFNAMYLIVTNYIFYFQKTVNLSLAAASVGALHILVAIVLVQKYELRGVAMAYIASIAARFMVTRYLAQRQHRTPWSSALTWQR